MHVIASLFMLPSSEVARVDREQRGRATSAPSNADTRLARTRRRARDDQEAQVGRARREHGRLSRAPAARAARARLRVVHQATPAPATHKHANNGEKW